MDEVLGCVGCLLFVVVILLAFNVLVWFVFTYLPYAVLGLVVIVAFIVFTTPRW